MDIKLIPASNGTPFTFPALPEKIQGKDSAKYQSYDIISLGTVKVPKGTDVTEISWEGEFFGRKKQNESIVKKEAWKEPVECVNIIKDYIKNETVLNLIVTETWINLDVTVSSFNPIAYGAFGNIKYSITFVQKKKLEIYTTDELKIANFVQKIVARNDYTAPAQAGSSYTVKKGDTLWAIAKAHLGAGTKWPVIYDANTNTIEAEAKKHGKSSSDHGHWIWPGEVLTIPSG